MLSREENLDEWLGFCSLSRKHNVETADLGFGQRHSRAHAHLVSLLGGWAGVGFIIFKKPIM